VGTGVLDFGLFVDILFDFLQMSLNVDMHVDNSPDFFIEFFIFEGLGKERNVFPFLVCEKFGEELFQRAFNVFIRDLRYEGL
jgi:hypothetical protein